MQKNYRILIILFAAITGTLFFQSCSKDDNPIDEPAKEVVPKETQKVTQFAIDVLQDVYLWSSTIKSVDVTKIKDPVAMVDSIRYSADRWTSLTDDAKGLTDSFAGEGTSYGYSLGVYLFSNTSNQCFAVVQFVYPGTPAEKAGMKRGDLILQMNGTDITTSNYYDLFYSSSVTLGMAALNGNVISLNNKTISLTAVSMYQEPVNTYKVINKGSSKIGYLFYTDYTLKSHEKLLEVLQSFKASGVTDVILDLRYNLGGYSLTSQILSSMLAPASIVSGKQIFLKQIWNDDYTAYWKKQGEDLNEYFSYTYNYEDEDSKKVSLSVESANLNLSRLFVLASGNTASASEATITGLSPYIKVTTIGEQTAGKYCGGIVFTPEDIYETPDAALKNWGIYTMVYRYADKNGNTACMPKGFKPDYEVADDPFDRYAMGDEAEPLLAKAIQLITGESVTTKAAVSLFRPKTVDKAISRKGALNNKLIELPGRYKLNKENQSSAR